MKKNNTVIITNKYAKKCCVCDTRVEVGQGFSVLRNPKHWDTYCVSCWNYELNRKKSK